MTKPFFHELQNLRSANDLYNRWVDYALSLTRDDIETLVTNGLTYQANALKSMIKEATAGEPMPPSLAQKLDMITSTTAKYAMANR